ncbi:MAG: Fe(2+) transporter permease subunit FeoB [Desulfurivibrio sp.]|nr:Fe(2+) transporter permease subunit FeoB [Desulfurivibrio sp.]
MAKKVIGVVGNPNCGKTTLFNALTGNRQQVGNWPGVTVERKTGEYHYGGEKVELVDLPGIYSLSAASLDEEVARDFTLSEEADLIVNIVDASNLERNLYLTVQLLEMKVPLVLALNMMDSAKEQQIEIDLEELSRRLGCPVVPLVAARGEGVAELRAAIDQSARTPAPPNLQVEYPGQIQEAVSKLLPLVAETARSRRLNPFYMAVKLLEGEAWVEELAGAEAAKVRDQLQQQIETELDEEVDILLADSRYRIIKELTQGAVKKRGRVGRTLSDKIDGIVLNRALGIPIFLLAMYLTFMVTINIGGAFIDFFDIFAGTVFVDGFGALLAAVGAPDWLIAVLATGIGGALQTMATFIPPIAFMFICLSFLEDSGYMARAAFVMDRFMRLMGLPGKSFVPMLVGFGCNVPAFMATRTLENQRDRLLTIMMTPFISCGARLPVYALFAAAFFPTGGQNLVFLLYLIGVGFAVFTGMVLKNTLLQGEATPFVMELPPYHLPTARGVLFRAYERLQSFMLRAGKILIPLILVLNLLNTLGPDGTIGHEDSKSSMLSTVGQSITPIFAPTGISEDNWPATVGIFTGILAKEAVVGTLDSLYAQLGAPVEGGGEEEPFNFWGGIQESLVSIPVNLAGVADTVLDPLGLAVGDVATLQSAAAEQEVAVGTFGAMAELFDGKVGAFAYLLMVLLYVPCGAAIAAIYRETNLRWTLFSCSWNGGLAYMAATVFYQAATFARHPLSSALWIGGLGALLLLAIMVMARQGNKERAALPLVSGRPQTQTIS